MAKTSLCCVALLVLAGTARAANPCGTLNFFPTAAQIAGTSVAAAASVDVTADVTCRGSQVCNWPRVLNRTAQEAYTSTLGASISADGLLSVAVKEYGAKQLRFFFMPSSPLLTASANAATCVLANLPAAATRKLQAASYTVTSPGTWSYSVTFSPGGTIDGGDKLAGAVGDVTFPTEGLQDDRTFCAAINIVLKGYTVSNAPAGFPAQIPLEYTACWYKHNGQARAKFDFGTCKNGTAGFTVNISAITPLAQNLTQNGAALLDDAGQPRLLLQPVIQVFGRMNKTLLGNELEDGASFVNKYFLLPASLKATDTVTLTLDDGELDEGFYHLSAKVAVISRFPSLVDLQGPASINQTDIEEVMGFTEYMGYLERNGTADDTPLIGLQDATRLPSISDISVNKESTTIKAGDALTFSWQFVAAGTEECFHDGVELAAPCGSPMIVAAKAFSANVTSHNLSVVLTDVCGRTKAANWSYTADGAKAVSEIDYVDPASMDEGATYGNGAVIGGGTGTARRGSTTSAAGGLLMARAGAAAAVAAALLLGLLL